jgi:DNA-binding response OmpR family regulator
MLASVVVVEDEELIALFVRETLELAGYAVVSFARGEAASRYLQAHQVTCAIIDVGLPDLSGEELARTLRRSQPELPIILSTGYSAALLEKSFAADPWLRVLAKPYNDTRLLVEFERLIATRPAAATGTDR